MLTFMAELKESFVDIVTSLLPYSPFAPIIDELEQLPYLGYVNWLIPIDDFITIGSIWLGAITTYYLLSILLRWLKAID